MGPKHRRKSFCYGKQRLKAVIEKTLGPLTILIAKPIRAPRLLFVSCFLSDILGYSAFCLVAEFLAGYVPTNSRADGHKLSWQHIPFVNGLALGGGTQSHSKQKGEDIAIIKDVAEGPKTWTLIWST